VPSSSSDVLNELLSGAIEALDITPQEHAAAETRYQAVGRFIAEQPDDHDWEVYTQGSFLLGTVVRPDIGGEIDIDLVCWRQIAKASTTQAELKNSVGRLLRSFVRANSKGPNAPTRLVDGRRAWTLAYEDAFHLDALPAIPDTDGSPTGILLTDKKLTRWLSSDPKAYNAWFRRQMATEFRERLQARAAALRKSVEQVPEWEIKTTLQQAVQVLKRHRDVCFGDDICDRPPSILITTLAAQAYVGQGDLFEAVEHTAKSMRDFIEFESGRWWVRNPVVASENFADKWGEYPERKAKFDAWLERVVEDLADIRSERGLDLVTTRLSKSFGAGPVAVAAAAVGTAYRERRESGLLTMTTGGLLGTTSGVSVPRHGFFGGDEVD
jgi:hypothetical protein